MSNLKVNNVMQKLSFFRAYSSLLIPAIISLVAVFILIFSAMAGNNLRGQMEKESVSVGKQVKSKSRGTVSRNQWEVEREYQQVYESDSNQIALLGIQTTRRELLSYEIFPKPKETSTLIFDEFGQRYRDGLDGFISQMKALDCPTALELERYMVNSDSSSRSRKGRKRRSSKFSEVDATIRDVLCRAKAESASVYANVTDLIGYEYWDEYEYIGMDEAVAECWYWQLGYWVIEDIAETISSMNSDSSSVLTSPVKRIWDIGFSSSSTDRGKGKGKSKAKSGDEIESDSPFYVLSEDEGLTKSFTGRFTNEEIDVIHFEFSVIIGNKDVVRFMQEFCSSKGHKFRGFDGKEDERIFKHNQITILESDIFSIDRESDEHELYRYGENAVVELYMVCEYIFNRTGYENIKPKSVVEETKKAEKD